MARKKRSSRNKPADVVSVEATAKKLQTLLSMPEIWHFTRSGLARGVREKLLSIDFGTIRNVVQRVPLIGAIINTRVEQISKFQEYVYDKGTPGFEFIWKDPAKKVTDADRKYFLKLSDFLTETGFFADAEREDDFSDYLEMIVRETLTIDQIATELQRNRKGEVIAFWVLDGAAIKRIDPKEFRKGFDKFHIIDDTAYCQWIEGEVYNVYTRDDLIFDYKNKRADLRFRGFGYSPTEASIDLITTLLFGYNYLRDQFMRDRVPKGFISVLGDVDRMQLDAIREYWYAAMSGAGGAWNIPILPSGKEGIGLDWKSIGHSNRDMEYRQAMMFLSSIIAAVFSIDLAELGIKSEDSTPLIGEAAEPRLEASKDRGLRGLLMFVQQHVNKIIRKVDPKVRFRFAGLESEDDSKLAEIRKKEVETRLTVNELRKMDGYEPLEGEYANVVLNPQAVQLINAEKQTQMQEQQMKMQAEQGPPGGEGGEGGEEEEDGDLGTEIDWEAMFAKSLGSKKKTVRVVIE